jgi:hypothetical protein
MCQPSRIAAEDAPCGGSRPSLARVVGEASLRMAPRSNANHPQPGMTAALP